MEGVYPALIMANGARAEGIEADLFFTFFGLDAITKKRWNHIKPATVGNPGLHLPTLLGGLPGVPDLITRYMERRMQKLDIPLVPEFIEMIAGTGAGIYACQASVDLFELGKDDLVEQIQGIITVGEFYEHAAGCRIVHT
ncbi:DsrE/DsrF/DrsH-like family protein [Streptomyces phaeochromogenes]